MSALIILAEVPRRGTGASGSLQYCTQSWLLAFPFGWGDEALFIVPLDTSRSVGSCWTGPKACNFGRLSAALPNQGTTSMASRHPKGLSLEVDLPRRRARFETGIDNPAEGESPAPGQRRLVRSAASDKFNSPSLGAALRNARATSGRRFAPYAHPELIPTSPGSVLSTTMSELELSDFVMYGGPVSSRTRAGSSWSASSSASPPERKASERRMPRHLRALAKAAEYASSTGTSPDT